MASNRDMLHVTEHNTSFVLRDSTGQLKKLWSENDLGRWIRRSFTRELRVRFLTGNYVEELQTHNLVTNIGHAAAAGRIGNLGSYGVFTNLGIGISANSAAVTDQALGNEIISGGGSRGAATATQATTTVTNDTLQLVKTFSFTATFAVTEEAIFDSANAPTVTTLAAALTAASTTASVASGTGITTNDYLQIDGEIVQVTAGAGTTTLTITRSMNGTTAAGHASGAGVVDIRTSGNMFAKQTFAVINVNNGDSLQLTHKVSC